ncbi:DUF4468 domain-containing protein [Candidatus Ornithobacterium hominis]|uniref:hypothetical protein n=1 Tax=Candidatus Ornithobacterium hominis TaxID=2497989 RepID=UPI0024BC8943|nr:hypothetical protein [Candidatus Ornithobacterium hominis]CAI9429280.1 DUF4468 domain-containing protein [Candidatus Ornithobacterium hominis]
MFKIKLLILTLILFANYSCAQSEKAKPIDHYFNVVDSLEFAKLKESGIIDKNEKIVSGYREKNSETLNSKGFEKLANIRAEVYANYFKDYLLLQSLDYKDDIYALYFSVAGFDDVEFQILKWKKNNWENEEKVDKRSVYEETNKDFEKIAFNYDEGPKNLENPKIFVKNDYLIMERSGLYYSLYDLKMNKLLINDESPWNSATDNSPAGLNKWIKENIHNKIEAKINNAYR